MSAYHLLELTLRFLFILVHFFLLIESHSASSNWSYERMLHKLDSNYSIKKSFTILLNNLGFSICGLCPHFSRTIIMDLLCSRNGRINLNGIILSSLPQISNMSVSIFASLLLYLGAIALPFNAEINPCFAPANDNLL